MFGHHPKVLNMSTKENHMCTSAGFATAVPGAGEPNQAALLGAAKAGPDCTHGSLFLHVFSCL